jgi:adenylate cyclase
VIASEARELDDRVRRKLTVALMLANAAGALVVLVFLAFVVATPSTDDPGALVRLNLIAFAVVLPVGILVGRAWSLRVAGPARAWLVAGRAPDEYELRVTLRQPLRLAGVSAALWTIGALGFGVLNAFESGLLALQVTVTVLMGALATCSLIYLICERVLRSTVALALASAAPERPALPGVTTRIVLAWAFGTGLAVLGSGLVAAGFLLGGPGSADRLAATVLFLSAAALLAGMTMVIIAARSVADPLGSVRRALADVERGDLETGVRVDDSSEVGLLQAGFNRMVAGLRERERMRDLFGRHVGEDVARRALAGADDLGGEDREVAVLFVDIIGSTTFAAERPPAAVVEALNRFFALVVDVVTEHGGWVNKFEGDAALCIFGAPTRHPDAAGAALAAGRSLDARLRGELPDLEAGIGLSAGLVVAGNIGARRRFEYTVIGDPVNEAARLTELAKTAAARVVASEAIVARAGDSEARHWRLGEAVTLRGRPEPTRTATPATT